MSVTSDSGVVGAPFLDAYCASKFALEGLMQALAPVAARFGITVSVVEPAYVAADIVGNSDLGAFAVPDSPYRYLGEKFLEVATEGMAKAQSASEAEAVVVEAAATDRLRFRWQTSRAATDAVCGECDGDGLSRHLWTVRLGLAAAVPCFQVVSASSRTSRTICRVRWRVVGQSRGTQRCRSRR